MANIDLKIGASATDRVFNGVTCIELPLSSGGTVIFGAGGGTGSGGKLVSVLDGTVTNLTAEDLAGLTETSYAALSGLSRLVSVQLPEGLVRIGGDTFSDDRSLSSVSFPSTLVYINEFAFRESAISSVSCGNSLTTIGAFAFGQCEALETVSIGSGLASLHRTAFFYCSSLETFTVAALTPPTISGDTEDDIFTGCTSLSAIYVPATSVAAYKAATGWDAYASIIHAKQD